MITFLNILFSFFFFRNQRNKLKLDNMSLPSPERHRPLRHLYSSDNMHVPPFNIPNLRIEQRKTSSAEDMARKNSTGAIMRLSKSDGFRSQRPRPTKLPLYKQYLNRIAQQTFLTMFTHTDGTLLAAIIIKYF